MKQKVNKSIDESKNFSFFITGNILSGPSYVYQLSLVDFI